MVMKLDMYFHPDRHIAGEEKDLSSYLFVEDMVVLKRTEVVKKQ